MTVIEWINELNIIPSPTDGENQLLEKIIHAAEDGGLPVLSITEKPFLKVPPVLIGNPDSKYILITHFDRVQENANPLYVCNNSIRTVEGKLDNTVSLAICLKLMIELKPQNTNLLITTGEENKLDAAIICNDPLGNTGGRGFISYLLDILLLVRDKYFIDIDVRPLDRGGVLKQGETRKYLNLGEGLVIRTDENRDKLDIHADEHLLATIRHCAAENHVTLTDYAGPGITELGRGWEKVLQPAGYAKEDYHITWIQPPITHYHTPFEQMSGNDIELLIKLVRALILEIED